MINKIPPLKQMLKQLQQVPYLASKNLYRVSSHFLDMDFQKLEQFCNVLIEAKQKLEKCSICCAWKEKKETCLFCADTKRDQGLVCVVETWQDLLAIEKTGGYKGVFHVLGGSICPLDGIGPEQLSIGVLVKRTQQDVKEIILALNQTPEGEATSAYIAQKLSSTVTVSCLAQGLPVGASLEYMDRLTVYKAISERRPF
ncbi:recombination protein RecR [bacterium]|jgi:recombination protein RecR|nr:recombination protein RecR [bacterium]MBT5015176.1 recombination protein RecR [bacterium]